MSALPQDFITSMQQQLGDHEAAQLCCALETSEAPVSLRLNPRKPLSREDTAALLTEAERVGWCGSGYYLPERPQFTLDPLFHAGCYYVQEASSMFIEQAWRTIKARLGLEGEVPASEVHCLDLCAAPGGKSTLWRSLLPAECPLVVNEPDRKRAEVLNENMQKWGADNVTVCNAYPSAFAAYAPGFFNVVAADVPCSGEGMFRKDPASRGEWSLKKVEECAALQRSIIQDVWPALCPGGFLVYSTCTFNRHEDEENVAWICRQLGARVVPLSVEKEWGIVEGRTAEGRLAGYHFFPHRAKGEGFFLCLLQKDGDGQPAARHHLEHVRHFSWEPYVMKGPKKVPQHVLAMNPATASAFPKCELSREEALSYLRREALCIDAPTGYVAVCYHGHPLGFVNNLGSRANNLYPQEWRIRHL